LSAGFAAGINKNGRARTCRPSRRFRSPSAEGIAADYYDSQVQSQPSAQLSQQPLSQPQSGHPSQQPLSLQQPVVGAAAGPEEANDRAPVERAAKAAKDQSALVNMMKLTFWLIDEMNKIAEIETDTKTSLQPLRCASWNSAARRG
jgi:hypothetical protein